MSKKMEFTVTITDENGEIIVKKTSAREVPFIEEIEAKGFRAAFDDLETAALELTKETREPAVAALLEEASKKKRDQSDSQEGSS